MIRARPDSVPVHNADQPETLEIVAEMRAVMDAYGDAWGLQVSPLRRKTRRSSDMRG